MAIRIKKGDYCVAKREGKKDFLFKALSDNDSKSVEAVVEKNSHIQGLRATLTVELSDVVLNLGPDPYPGKVYGHDVGTLHKKRMTHEKFGDVHWFYKPPKEVGKDLWASMDVVAAKLKKAGLEFLLWDQVYEVHPYHGEKYAGSYAKAKTDKIPDRTMIRPEIMPASEYAYVLQHELGHRLHLRFCAGATKLNANWLKAYNKSIKVVSVKKDKSQQLLDMLLDGEECPSSFKSGLDEEDALAFKWIIRTIGQINGLSIKDLDLLFEAEMKDEIRGVWPIRNLHRKELAPIISEYATVNVKELVAESFAFYMTGRKLPEAILKLVEKTIAYAKANKDKEPESD